MSLYRFLASSRELKEDNSLKIVIQNDLSVASKYTDKKNCATLASECTDQNVDLLIAYIKEHLKICPRIELWRTGVGKAVIEKCSKNILSKDKIKELWSKDSIEPACLVVYNA